MTMTPTWKVKAYGESNDINKVEFVVSFTDGSCTWKQSGVVPIEPTLPHTSTEAEIIDAVKAQMGETSVANLQAAANLYRDEKVYLDKDSEVYLTSSSLTEDELLLINGKVAVLAYDMIVALKNKGFYDTVKNWVTNSGTEDDKAFWEYCGVWYIDSTRGRALLTSAGLSSTNIDDVFKYAYTLTNY